MAQNPIQRNGRPGVGQIAVGAVMVGAGALILGWLVYIGNSASRAAEQAMFSVGLAGAALISAFAQLLVLVGAWLVWRARRRD